MKKTLLFLLIGSSFYFSQTFNTVPVLQNGSNDKRLNIAVLGDGFTSTQQTSFVNAAQSTVNYLFTKSPYKEYKNYFNAYAIQVISPESGVKHPGTATDVAEPVIPVSNPNNYLGSTFDVNVHRCIYTYSSNKVAQVLSANVPDYDLNYVLVNSTEYGGCGGTYAFASLNPAANEIVVHELGHSFAKLADEYWFSGSGESANKTQTSNPATIKWKNWIGTNNVGIYSHAEDPSWFRPHQNCEMRYLDREFCSVCKEATIERIHALLSPIDSYMPANSTVIDASSDVTFTVNEILPIPNTLVNTWTLNGTALSTAANTLTITPAQLNQGNNTLLFSVTDNTQFVRTDNHNTVHLTTVTWILNKATLGTAEVKAEERRFSIYPNPAKNEIFINGKKDFSKNLQVRLYDASGKLINVKHDLENAQTLRLQIQHLASGMYSLQILENQNLIISQKIIKE